MFPQSFMKLCEDTRNICCYAKHTSPTLWSFTLLGVWRNVHKHSSMLQTGWFGLPHNWCQRTEGATWPWHLATCHFYLALPLWIWIFNIWHECKIYLSECGRYKVNCAIPPFQNTQMDHTKVVRCTLSVNCLTDLDYCVVSGNLVSVFLDHILFSKFLNDLHLTFPCFCLFCLPFCSSSKHHNSCNIHLKSESIKSQLQIELPWQNCQVVFGQLTVFTYTLLKHYSHKQCSWRPSTNSKRALLKRADWSPREWCCCCLKKQTNDQYNWAVYMQSWDCKCNFQYHLVPVVFSIAVGLFLPDCTKYWKWASARAHHIHC